MKNVAKSFRPPGLADIRAIKGYRVLETAYLNCADLNPTFLAIGHKTLRVLHKVGIEMPGKIEDFTQCNEVNPKD
jgi:hypothetical protein